MEFVETWDAVQATRAFFLGGAAAGILLCSIPFLRTRFVDYGTRSSNTGSKLKDPNTGKPQAQQASPSNSYAAFSVPHSYFLHYYVFSLICSLFWGIQILSRGRILQWLAKEPEMNRDEETMHIDQVVLMWALMAAQGYRRLHETIICTKPSESTMPLSIYLLGLAYYFMVNIAVWIEGTNAIFLREDIIQSFDYIKVPSLKTMICFPIFLIASGIQNDCHRYLASLEKYTLPTHPIFQKIVCPHYLMECVIYLSMAIMAAPKGQWVNKTVFTVFIWVLVNLGLVADSAKSWSMKKFGPQQVSSRWRMIPWIW